MGKSRTLERMERKQSAVVRDAEARMQDARDLRKRGPRSGDLGQSFERQMDLAAARESKSKADAAALRALRRHIEGG